MRAVSHGPKRTVFVPVGRAGPRRTVFMPSGRAGLWGAVFVSFGWVVGGAYPGAAYASRSVY